MLSVALNSQCPPDKNKHSLVFSVDEYGAELTWIKLGGKLIRVKHFNVCPQNHDFLVICSSPKKCGISGILLKKQCTEPFYYLHIDLKIKTFVSQPLGNK